MIIDTYVLPNLPKNVKQYLLVDVGATLNQKNCSCFIPC